MALGLIVADYPAAKVRKLVQPIALIGYFVALLLHGATGWGHIVSQPYLPGLVTAVIIGSLAGRLLGPSLPGSVISGAVRGISLIAGLILLYRAVTLT